MRPSVHLREVSFAHTTATPVLDRVTLDLSTGWTGVVGANGAGKTTLLRLVAGDLPPSSGTVQVVSSIPPVTCAQEVGGLDEDVQAFAWDWSGPAAATRSRLALDPVDLERWPTLSPGERKRWQVGAALASEPDVLLLDEPTNHLDAEARDLLLAALVGFHGVGLVVSHDRDLLDRITTRTMRVVAGRVDDHAGPYTAARQRWEADAAARRDEHARARREQRRLTRVLGDIRHDRQGAERSPRAARRANPDQPDVREAGRKFAQQKAEAKLAARVGQLRTRVERAVDGVASIQVEPDHGGEVHLDGATGARRRPVVLGGDVALPDGTVLLRDLDLVVHRGEHVHVAGPNGAGKSTLLRALRDVAPGPVGWLPQDLDDDAVADVVASLRRLDPDLRGRALGIVARLGVDPDRLLVTDRPSPGEARKVAITLLLLDSHDLVVLDEPTNHLDVTSIERLEQALGGYPGALLLVTHDRALAAAVTTTRWTVTDGVVAVSRPSSRPAPGPRGGSA